MAKLIIFTYQNSDSLCTIIIAIVNIFFEDGVIFTSLVGSILLTSAIIIIIFVIIIVIIIFFKDGDFYFPGGLHPGILRLLGIWSDPRSHPLMPSFG